MTPAVDLPAWCALLCAALLLLGATLTFIGSTGLLRLGNFYQRAHAPTLGSTLGIGCIALASMIYFTVTQSRPVLHEIAIAVFAFVTTPVTLLLLVRATLHRSRYEDMEGSPPPDADDPLARKTGPDRRPDPSGRDRHRQDVKVERP